MKTPRLLKICTLPAFLAICAAAILCAPGARAADKVVIRIGHFPNITHLQALVAQNFSRQGKGWFEKYLGPDVSIEWYTYNAGPGAMEAIFAKSIDLTYVGPGPSINAYTKSKGEEIRIIAGAAQGGTALVIQPDQDLKVPADFKGKKIATPQLGNTQDIACRVWLINGGLNITQTGGDAQVIPTENPDQLTLFAQKKIDAVWTVEPWVSRLELDAKGKVLIQDTTSAITVLVSSSAFLSGHRDLAKKIVQANKELTEWIQKNPEEAQKLAIAELAAETHSTLSPELIAKAWKRITLSSDIPQKDVEAFVGNSLKTGFIKAAPDLSRLFEAP